jgi:hypothetical protein
VKNCSKNVGRTFLKCLDMVGDLVGDSAVKVFGWPRPSAENGLAGRVVP